jgi:flagellar hook-associated protein 3 FlgL
MKVDGISTLNIRNALQSAVSTTQRLLLRAQVEYATGRHEDVGLTLGRGVSTNLDLRSQISAFESMKTIHRIAATKAELTQAGLGQLKDIANAFISALSGARTAQNGQQLAEEAARTAYTAIWQVLETTFDGQAIFSGINTGNPGLTKYPGSAAESAIDNAFLLAFGFLPTSPLAINITPSQLQNHIDTAFQQEFQDPNWNANWSDASSVTPQTTLEGGAKVNLSTTANSQAIRDLVRSVVSVLSMSKGQLNSSTFSQLADQAMAGASEAVLGIANEQSRIGLGQEELNRSTERITKKSDLLKAWVQDSEGVDQYEAAMRMNQLMTQLEASYAITAKISKLTLANYL